MMEGLRERFDGLLFDLDGTLIETAPDLTHALNHALRAAGRPPLPQEVVRTLIGDGARMLLSRGLMQQEVAPTPEEIARWLPVLLEHYGDHIADESRPFAGCVETLRQFREAGIRLAVCTNKTAALTERLLGALGVRDLFDAVLGGDSLPVRKPHPGHIEGTLEALGVTASRAAMIGDSNNDVRAARAAGVPVVVVSFGYTATPAAELGADAVIDSYQALPGALAALA